MYNAFVDTQTFHLGRTATDVGFNGKPDKVYDLCDVCEYAPIRTSETSSVFTKHDSFEAYATAKASQRGFASSFDIGGAVTALAGFLSAGATATAAAGMFNGNKISSSGSNSDASTNSEAQSQGFVMYEYQKTHGVHQHTLQLDTIEDSLMPWARQYIDSLPHSFETSSDNSTFRDLFARTPPFIVWRTDAGGAIRTTATIAADSAFETQYSASAQARASSSGILWFKKSSSSSSQTESEEAETVFRQQAVYSHQILGGNRVGFSSVDSWTEAEVEKWASTVEDDPKVVGFQIVPITKFIRDKKTRDATALAMLDFYGKLGTLTPQEHAALRQAAAASADAKRAQQAVDETNAKLAKAVAKGEALELKLGTTSSDVTALTSELSAFQTDTKTDFKTASERITKATTDATKALEAGLKDVAGQISGITWSRSACKWVDLLVLNGGTTARVGPTKKTTCPSAYPMVSGLDTYSYLGFSTGQNRYIQRMYCCNGLVES